MDRLRRLSRAALGCLALLLAAPQAPASVLAEWFGDPRIQIDGAGFMADLRLKRALELLAPAGVEAPELSRVFIEDSVWLIAGDLRTKGFRRPSIALAITWEDGTTFETSWSDPAGFADPLPQGKVAAGLAFEIEKGRLYFFGTDGVTIDLPAGFTLSREPCAYFYAADASFISEEDRFFTDGRLGSGTGQIATELKDQGYRDARVVVTDREIDHDTGAVSVALEVTPGPKFYVREAELTFVEPEGTETRTETFEEQLFTQSWLNQYVFGFRGDYYARGYPDAVAFYEIETIDADEGTTSLRLAVRVESGPQVRVGEIRFDGAGQTSSERMLRVLPIQSGDLLNPNEVQQGRGELRQLNIFQEVEAEYEPTDDPAVRDVLYDTRLRENFAVDLIFGAGTFDLIRTGFEVTQNNLWHLAHQQRLRVIQSLKTSSADYQYNIPKLFGGEMSLFGNLDVLRRQQLNFLRQEFGAGLGVQRFWAPVAINASVEARIEAVSAEDLDSLQQPGADSALITNLLFRASQTAINNPVFPSEGHRLNASLEVGYPSLSDIEYQALEVGAAFHRELTRSLIFHAAFTQGILANFTGTENIPVNQRFLVGGENTVRGYQRDEASPKDEDGNVIGAESYTLAQVQLEQRLTSVVSLNVFVDSVAVAAELGETFSSEVLTSVGGGIAFRTPIGPLRFEYGHNLTPRDDDPGGTFHFSLGFPF